MDSRGRPPTAEAFERTHTATRRQWAYGINERRQVVGVSCDAQQTDCRAVVWDHGAYPTDLNDLKGGYSASLALAKDINDKGEITGRAVDLSTGALIAYLAVPVDNN